VFGKFSNDSIPDYVSIDKYYGKLFVHLGNGAGGFDTVSAAGHNITSPRAIAVGSYNTDSTNDVFVVRANELQVWTGTGTGSLNGPSSFALNNAGGSITPAAIALANVDGDTDQDVITVGGSVIKVLPRIAAPNYFNPDSVITITLPSASLGITDVEAADVDKDEKLDLVVAIRDGSQPRHAFLKGDGAGNFTYDAALTWSMPYYSEDFELVDLDGDEKLDIVGASGYTSSDVYVRLGDASGLAGMFGDNAGNIYDGFEIGATATSGAYGLSVADVTGDGELDAVVTEYDPNYEGRIFVFAGNGNGGFTNSTSAAYRSYTWYGIGTYVHDFNLDGATDVLVMGAYEGSNSGEYLRWSTPMVNDGAGKFTPAVSPRVAQTAYTTSSYRPWDVAVGDFDVDGDMDMAFSMEGNDQVGVSLGNGRGGFSRLATYPTGDQPRRLVTGDFNSDTATDLLVGNFGSTFASIVPYVGNGQFSSSDVEVAGTGAAVDLVAGDFDSDLDGRLDFVRVADTGSSADQEFFQTHLADGDLSFASPLFQTLTDSGAGLNPLAMAKGDLDEDGNLDLVVALQGGDVLEIWLGNGDGTFATGVPYAVGNDPNVVTIADIDRDGHLDVLVGLRVGSDNLKVFFGDGSGTIDVNDAAMSETLSTPGGFITRIGVRDLNGDCMPDIVAVKDDPNLTNDDGAFVFVSTP
jgi:hypothetical protein